MVWRYVLSNQEWTEFVSQTEIGSWTISNLYSRQFSSSFGGHWPYIFRQLVHDLWLNYTAASHQSPYFLENPYALAKRGLLTVMELLLSWA